MALTRCKECGTEVSTKAKACPKCGASLPKQTSWFTLLVAALFLPVIGLFMWNLATNESPPTTPARSQPAVQIDKSPEKQKGRQELIQKLIGQGIFQKVDMGGGSLPKVWVQPAFYDLDFDTKSQFVAVVYAYYFTGDSYADHVILRDAKSGKEVGKYHPQSGGLKMD